MNEAEILKIKAILTSLENDLKELKALLKGEKP
jgi:hypothetical protein